ncbi:MAG: nodulation protein NfeD [Actinobacteria bacterium]|nr:nodulation protein NfeD [Actinomycetota bacterium]
MLLLAGLLAGLSAAAAGGAATAADDGDDPAGTATRTVATTTIAGAITPVVADHLTDTLRDAAAQGHEALVVTLDTPGGLVTSMRVIVQSFLNAPLPVIVHVAPSGADAGSAGTFITLSAHVAAMAPATTIGAATPVDLEGGEVGDKIVNNAAAYAEAIAEARDRDVEFAVQSVRDGRSITAEEALEIGAIDLVSPTTETLLEDVDGTEVELTDGDRVTLATAGASTVELEMTGARRLLQRLADPNLAFIFISIGTLAIIYELANPGLGAGGIVGGAMLILAMFALSVLPVTFAGASLLVLAGIFLVAELFAPGIGIGAGGGSLLLVLGGLFLFDEPSGLRVGLPVLLPTVLVVLGSTILAGVLVRRTRDRPSHYTSDELLDRTAVVAAAGDELRVRIDGTSWRVRPAAGTTVLAGDRVRVVDRDNLDLVVTPTDMPSTTPAPEEPQ